MIKGVARQLVARVVDEYSRCYSMAGDDRHGDCGVDGWLTEKIQAQLGILAFPVEQRAMDRLGRPRSGIRAHLPPALPRLSEHSRRKKERGMTPARFTKNPKARRRIVQVRNYLFHNPDDSSISQSFMINFELALPSKIGNRTWTRSVPSGVADGCGSRGARFLLFSRT